MRAVILRSLPVIGGGGLVLAGVLYVASTVDARPPPWCEIALTQPLPDEPGLGLITTSIEVAFSEPVEAEDAATRSRSSRRSRAGQLERQHADLHPGEPLELATAYR